MQEKWPQQNLFQILGGQETDEPVNSTHVGGACARAAELGSGLG